MAGNSGTATFPRRPNTPGASITCPAISLDSYAEREGIENIRLIKMDIEGAEPFALRGMVRVLSSPNPPAIICEAVPYLLESSGHELRDIFRFPESYGYHGRRITDDGLADFDVDGPQSPTADCNLYFSRSAS